MYKTCLHNTCRIALSTYTDRCVSHTCIINYCGQVALGHVLDHCMARSPALPTHRLGEEDASKGLRVGGGVAPVVTSPDETVGETGLTRSASHLLLRDCMCQCRHDVHCTIQLCLLWVCDTVKPLILSIILAILLQMT